MSENRMTDQRKAAERLLGQPARLPLRVAAEVARRSIRVRLSRSLVTLSSVVLAVAFLLSVLGDNLARQAVWRSYAADQQPIEHAAQVRTVLESPRPTREALRLIGSPTPSLRANVSLEAAMTADLPERELATFALALRAWVGSLKAGNRALILRHLEIDDWLLNMDAPAMRTFIAEARRFRGVRLDWTDEQLQHLATNMPRLRAALATFAKAESARLGVVDAAGGVPAVLAALEEGADASALLAKGLPLDQIGEGIADRDLERLRAQVALDRRREAANKALQRVGQGSPLRLADLAVVDAALLQGKPLSQPPTAAATMIRTVDAQGHLDSQLEALRQTHQAELVAMAKAGEAALAAVETERSKRSSSGQSALASLEDARISLQTELRKVTAACAVNEAATGVGLIGLLAESERRSALETQRNTFVGLGYDPQGASERTFWLVVLSLAVCVVGIVNSMMMAVTERFREIATMKCLGATDGFIMKAFLIESGAVGVVGALLGSCLGLALAMLQASSRFGAAYWQSFPVVPLANAVVLALICGVVLTVLGALLPAWRAARMHPIEAMRLEA